MGHRLAFMEQLHDVVLVVDFGAQYAQLIARRVREANVYLRSSRITCQCATCSLRNPPPLFFRVVRPRSTQRAPRASTRRCLTLVCRCWASAMDSRPWPRLSAVRWLIPEHRSMDAPACALRPRGSFCPVFPTISVWMSHGDSVSRAPEGFSTLARTAGAPVAAFEDVERRLVGVQWHPEVHHTESGQTVLEHFLSTLPDAVLTGMLARSSATRSRRFVVRLVTGASSADCRAASILLLLRLWCSALWATSSPAFSSITDCCVKGG